MGMSTLWRFDGPITSRLASTTIFTTSCPQVSQSRLSFPANIIVAFCFSLPRESALFPRHAHLLLVHARLYHSLPQFDEVPDDVFNVRSSSYENKPQTCSASIK
jgi:hypothetical protein